VESSLGSRLGVQSLGVTLDALLPGRCHHVDDGSKDQEENPEDDERHFERVGIASWMECKNLKGNNILKIFQFFIIPTYSCIVNKEVAIELIIRKPGQIRYLLWRRNNETVIAYITRNYQLCIIYQYHNILYDIPDTYKNIECEINQ